ncbi:hypothetical protein OUO06_20120 (plasmid) [Photobacterium damselae]|uniref:hypothetical protein n=1 Tax=Photobacterium damselae TaxID=38293 RepID=UPI003C6E8363
MKSRLSAVFILIAASLSSTANADKSDKIFMVVSSTYYCGIKYENTEFKNVFEAIYNLMTEGNNISNNEVSQWEEKNKSGLLEKVKKEVKNSNQTGFCFDIASGFFNGVSKEIQSRKDIM